MEVESLFAIVSKGQATGSHVNTERQAETPGSVATQVTVKEFPADEEYPSWQLIVCISNVEPRMDVESLFKTVSNGHETDWQE